MVLISQYQRLCDRKYVGNAANATADWWYKTSDPEGTVRNVNGAYMRVLDRRGLFGRAAGQNSKYKMANDAPYDGKGIGEHIPDAIQNITGSFIYDNTGIASICVEGAQGAFYTYTLSAVSPPQSNGTLKEGGAWVLFDASRVARTAGETRVASIAYYPCIKY
jgi:hypothetical protein